TAPAATERADPVAWWVGDGECNGSDHPCKAGYRRTAGWMDSSRRTFPGSGFRRLPGARIDIALGMSLEPLPPGRQDRRARGVRDLTRPPARSRRLALAPGMRHGHRVVRRLQDVRFDRPAGILKVQVPACVEDHLPVEKA